MEGIPADYAAVFVFSVKDFTRVCVFFSRSPAGHLMSVFSCSCHPPGSCIRMHVPAWLLSEHSAGHSLPPALRLVSTEHLCMFSWWEIPPVQLAALIRTAWRNSAEQISASPSCMRPRAVPARHLLWVAAAYGKAATTGHVETSLFNKTWQLLAISELGNFTSQRLQPDPHV